METIVNGVAAQSADRYQGALADCHLVAQKELGYVRELIVEVGADLNALDRRAKRLQDKRGLPSEVSKTLSGVRRQVSDVAAEHLEVLEQSLARKERSLRQFTVTLFGRTMAGKSTIRETITRGDGSTIGTGAQRTTQEVREYVWNHLRIVDTPGIGAYRGDDDRVKALDVIDESDVILFLLSSDGIQEETFRGMQALRNQNKTMIFVLNVKMDLTKRVLRKRFLADPARYLDGADVAGHRRRVETLAKEWLQAPRVRLVPVHAQAGFLSTRPENAEDENALRRASGLDALLDVLEDEVGKRGVVRRTQTMLDGTSAVPMDMAADMRAQAGQVRSLAAGIESKFREIDVWLDQYIESTNRMIPIDVAARLAPLRMSVSYFVDEHLESEAAASAWKRRLKDEQLEAWAVDYRQRCLDDIRAQLHELNRQIALDVRVSADVDGGLEQVDPWDVKRTLRWTSAIGAAAGGVAAVGAWLGSTNFWNPVGWVAGAVSIGALALSFLFDDREEVMRRERAAASGQLRRQIDAIEHALTKQLRSWFYDKITRNLVRGVRTDTRSLVASLRRLASATSQAARELDYHVDACNLRLYRRAAERSGIPPGVFHRVARDPGIAAKLVTEKPRFSSSRHAARDLGRLLGEVVDIVPDDSPEAMVARALVPARVRANDVREEERSFVVTLPRGEIGRAVGRGGANVQLATRAIGKRIQILERVNQ